ncbi:low-density lipoprotein receptor-related protein 2-like [Bolinopsis microptera]|uniref:low-density lipoprotein receptor-related protein 2-like n=1 Tax=Bolinopsis microptera TaxID=2820187 RepID=UPI00307AA0D0
MFYQMCAAINLDCNQRGEEGITSIEETHYHSKFLCARAVCDNGDTTFGLDDICGHDHDEECKNIQYSTDTCAVPDDTDHTYTCRTPWKKEIIDSNRLCDKVCDCYLCDDEAICNGFTYGILCTNIYTKTPYYQPAYFICDGRAQCFYGTDEMNCQEGPMCKQRFSDVTRPMVNGTRCAPLFLNIVPYCEDYSDQLNCTDPSIANLTCFRGGYPVSVADRMRCHGITELRLCDDGFEDMCVRIDITCKVHKHQICDKVKDCFNGADELHVTCRSMSKYSCKRAFGMENRVLKVPLSWINDGYKDCEDGIDEGVVYPTCGFTPATMRLKKDNEECGEVFLCGSPPSGHIEFEHLCDQVNTCGNENALCQKAFDSPGIHQKIDSYENHMSVSYCLKGLDKLSYVAGNCSKTDFGYQGYELLGRTQLLLDVPETKFDCKYVYGEMYVYLACIGQCAASICPLEDPIRHDSCLGQYPSRVYTLADNNFLTFLLPYGDNKYHNNLFPCENGLCIPYEKVCNLANDCGDFSDEILCNNHFQCPNSTEYIPLSSVCDGKPDCIDYSDECNGRCNVRIIENTVLTTVAWLLGSLATLLNLIIIIRGMYTFRKASTVAMLLNKLLILLIAFGDLLIGIYLLAISIYHESQYHSYCPNRFEWLTSRSCAFMGIVNTVGSQLSLFSMTVLSLSRVLRMNKLSISNETTLKSSIPVFLIGTLILIASCLVAAVPLFEPFEDFFVNGINYPRSPLFVGSVTKFKHLEIFEEYFGRMRNKDLSWKNIDRLVVSMFSDEYGAGGITRNQVHFYGNAGVCLFKYFVTSDDSQRIYVWCTLFLNIICFASITMAYIIIHFISAKSSSQCANNNGNEQLRKRNKRLQRKITLIIGTDFCCWIPFIVMCFLHSLEVTDASPYYSLFSIVVLPINSVINPLLYDETVSLLLSKIFRVSRQQFRTEASAVTGELEMNSIQDASHVTAHTTVALREISPAMTAPEHDYKTPETVKLESQSGSRVEHQPKAKYINVSEASQIKGVKKMTSNRARVVTEILNERLEEEGTGRH